MSLPIIKDPNQELSESCCPPKPGIKELHKIHRMLPRRHLHNSDPEVLQDEAGLPILDEQTAGFIYDDIFHELII
jgi:hypothetical protein